jgi:membrane protein implicated in regulation of membrane protease activity
VIVQSAVFVLVSLIALAATRPLVKKYQTKEVIPTNSDRNIGKEAIVTAEINNDEGTGLVKVGGEVWSARSADNKVIALGQTVIVKAIEGVKLIVT